MQIIPWLVAAMFAWAPARQSERARYTEIASDLVTVVYDSDESPLFAGDGGRARTALVLASIRRTNRPFAPTWTTGTNEETPGTRGA